MKIEDYISKNIDSEFISKLIDEDFKKIGRVHDWRNYIDEEVSNNWAELTEREKCLLFIMAEKLSDSEHWD